MEPKDINFAAMPQTAVNVVTKPAEFFQSMPKTGGFLEPLVFVVIMGLVSGVLQAILSMVGLGYGHGMMGGFGTIIFMPIAFAIGSFIGAAILFVVWKLMGSQEDYETAYRCCAYLAALSPITSILGYIPYAGILINMAIFAYYTVAASVHVHQIPSQKAWLVFGILTVIFALLGLSAEYRGRQMAAHMGPWSGMDRQSADEFRRSVRDAGQNADEMRKQAEKMAREYEQQRRLQEQED